MFSNIRFNAKANAFNLRYFRLGRSRKNVRSCNVKLKPHKDSISVKKYMSVTEAFNNGYYETLMWSIINKNLSLSSPGKNIVLTIYSDIHAHIDAHHNLFRYVLENVGKIPENVSILFPDIPDEVQEHIRTEVKSSKLNFTPKMICH